LILRNFPSNTENKCFSFYFLRSIVYDLSKKITAKNPLLFFRSSSFFLSFLVSINLSHNKRRKKVKNQYNFPIFFSSFSFFCALSSFFFPLLLFNAKYIYSFFSFFFPHNNKNKNKIRCRQTTITTIIILT
jgi:hypothetical protein